MKGVIWKYHANANDFELSDKMGRAGCRLLNPDPDFRENGFPVWAICGPWVRATLDPGDVLFFVPTPSSCQVARIQDTPLAGYLLVQEILADGKALLADRRFTSRYRENYKIDLREHLKRDRPKTRSLRPKNIVAGDPQKSQWLGRKGLALSQAIREASIPQLSLKSRRIRNLSEQEARALLTVLQR